MMTGMVCEVHGLAVEVRAIGAAELDDVPAKCWDGRAAQERLIADQEILGFGAWDDDRCIAQLHCYRVMLPEYDDAAFPGYGRSRPVWGPLGWPLVAAKAAGLSFSGPVWGHACFHVGLVAGARGADRRYFGRGIGTVLCRESVKWAQEHGYAAVIAHGGTKAAPEYNVWMGCLPWTTYARQGFECVAMEDDGQRLPWWAKGEASPETMAEVRAALEAGCRMDELCARVMVKRL